MFVQQQNDVKDRGINLEVECLHFNKERRDVNEQCFSLMRAKQALNVT